MNFNKPTFKTIIIELTRSNFSSNYGGSGELRSYCEKAEFKDRTFQISFPLNADDVDRTCIRASSIKSDKLFDHFQEFTHLFGNQYQAIVMLKNPNDFPETVELKYVAESAEIIQEQIRVLEDDISKLNEKIERIENGK